MDYGEKLGQDLAKKKQHSSDYQPWAWEIPFNNPQRPNSLVRGNEGINQVTKLSLKSIFVQHKFFLYIIGAQNIVNTFM